MFCAETGPRPDATTDLGEMSPEMVVNFDSVRVLAGDAGCVVVVVVVVVGRFVVDDDTGAVVGDAAPDAR
jgi:hypothetical protein